MCLKCSAFLQNIAAIFIFQVMSFLRDSRMLAPWISQSGMWYFIAYNSRERDFQFQVVFKQSPNVRKFNLCSDPHLKFYEDRWSPTSNIFFLLVHSYYLWTLCLEDRALLLIAFPDFCVSKDPYFTPTCLTLASFPVQV